MQRHNKIPLGGLQVWPKVPTPPMLRVGFPCEASAAGPTLRELGDRTDASHLGMTALLRAQERRPGVWVRAFARWLVVPLVIAVAVVGAVMLAGCSDLGGELPVCVWGPVG